MSLNSEESIARRLEVLRMLKAKRRIALIKRKAKKPIFLRWLWWKFSKFENNLKWKKPRGKDNPVRLALKGYPPKASAGYGLPAEIKNMHPCGLKPVVIRCAKDLESLNPAKHVIYIASNVGLKKKLELIKVAKSKGFKIINAQGEGVYGS
jgi:large subunit ribosomal protein L32e